MDTITHGIVGTLLGKGYFAERYGRTATFAAAIGAMFPDIDVVAEFTSSDPLSLIRYHRGITHSFIAMPFFAAGLAWLTHRLARRRGLETPSQIILTVIYLLAITSHIVLDGMTSFGTRMWTPLSQRRVAWDLLFIIDFVFSSLVLLPQVAAWVFGGREKWWGRAIRMWAIFSLGALGVWELARSVGFPFRIQVAALASAVFLVLFFLPARGEWGFRMTRAAWCRAGVYTTAGYLFICASSHHSALERVRNFAAENHISVDHLAAIPLPPSLLSWGGLIRASDGVYQTHIDLRNSQAPSFRFIADSPPDEFLARAMQLPDVQLYWNFARFPVIRTETDGVHHVVEFGEYRFVNPRRGRPQPFTFRVVFDGSGRLIEEGWQSNGLLQRRMRTIPLRRQEGETN